MQKQTLVKNGNLRIEGASELAKTPFEGFKHEYGDFHVLEMVQYGEIGVEAFIAKALDLINQYQDSFDSYRSNDYEIVLFISINHGAGLAQIKPDQLAALAENNITLELMDYPDEFI